MAYTKKTDLEKNNIEDTEMNKEEVGKQTKKRTPKKFSDSDYVLCRSVWVGGLNIICPSGNTYEFSKYDAECEIIYRDLVSLIRKHSDHIFLPRFVILDDDFLEDYPNVKKVYGEMYTASDLMGIINLPNTQMKREIEKLPKESRDMMCKMISTEIAKGHIDSISKVRLLSEIFNSDFELISKLFIRN